MVAAIKQMILPRHISKHYKLHIPIITFSRTFSRIYLKQIFRKHGVSLLAHSVVDSKLSEENRRIRKSTQHSTPTTMKLEKNSFHSRKCNY